MYKYMEVLIIMKALMRKLETLLELGGTKKAAVGIAMGGVGSDIAIILAITGILNPVVGALVHNAGSIFVIINSILLLKWRIKNDI